MIETIFLLSPAHLGGRRAATLLRPGAKSDLAQRLRTPQGADLAEVFSFISGLYFRGKVTYALAFGTPPEGIAPAFVITSGRGLLPVSTRVTLQDLEEFATIPVDPAQASYRDPLVADAERIASLIPAGCRVVLLGSIATAKYVELLLVAFGTRLCFPAPFLGTGDMARGAMMLNAAREGVELPYEMALGAIRSRAKGRTVASKR